MSANPNFMSASLKNISPLGSTEININEASEVRHWTQHWNVSEAELRRVIADVGPDVNEVRTALGR